LVFSPALFFLKTRPSFFSASIHGFFLAGSRPFDLAAHCGSLSLLNVPSISLFTSPEIRFQYRPTSCRTFLFFFPPICTHLYFVHTPFSVRIPQDLCLPDLTILKDCMCSSLQTSLNLLSLIAPSFEFHSSDPFPGSSHLVTRFFSATPVSLFPLHVCLLSSRLPPSWTSFVFIVDCIASHFDRNCLPVPQMRHSPLRLGRSHSL